MGLTNGHAAFASLSASAINRFIYNLAKARPRYFRFASGSPPSYLGPFEHVPALHLPGASGGGVDYILEITLPQLDLYPGSGSQQLPAPLTLGPNQFSITTGLTICIAKDYKIVGHKVVPVEDCATLNIWAVGELSTSDPHNVQLDLGAHADNIILKNVGDLESIGENLSLILVNALLQKMTYPVKKQALGALTFSVADGPRIEDQQIKAWGDLS